jgi:hypothetical protein
MKGRRTEATGTHRPRLTAAAVALVLALVALGAHSAKATFTATQAVTQGTISPGTVSFSVGTNTLTTAIDIYPGLTVQRLITLTNSGSLDVKSITVTPTFGASSLDDELDFSVWKCSQDWSGSSPSYSCGGTMSSESGPHDLVDSTPRDLTAISNLTASSVNRYMFSFTLGTASPAAAYGQSLAVTFTFTATQRDGTNR